MRVFPFFIHNSECNIFIRRSCYEDHSRNVRIILILDDFVSRCFSFIYKIWIEDVELVSLYYFWRRVILIVVCLVVSVRIG